MAGPRRKIAILGGGMASLTAAAYLTAKPGWEDEYEITVYQYGWRLGGKGASGRNPDHHLRNQEHGLHVWFGFYENAFATLRSVYAAMDFPPEYPIRTVEQAFRAHTEPCQIVENVDDQWKIWPIQFPAHGGIPGVSGSREYTTWEVVILAIDAVINLVSDWVETVEQARHPVVSWLAGHLERFPGLAQAETALDTGLHQASRLAHRLDPDAAKHDPTDRAFLRKLLKEFHDWLAGELRHLIDTDDELRRLWIMANLALSTLVGLFDDQVFERGLSSLDGEELRTWLGRHGVTEANLASAPVRMFYETFFAVRTDGDEVVYDFAAGVGLGCGFRSALTYLGAALFEMQAGMGDIVVSPVYRLLRQRGVKFEFFSKVRKIALTPNGSLIGRVHIGKQATVKNGFYEPLFDVKGLMCWPSHPFYDQLVQGDALKAQGVNLESHWADWPDVEEQVLELGVDFDQVLLGISLGGLKDICQELCEAHDGWAAMIDQVPTMQSMGVQLWLNQTDEALGWTSGSAAVTAGPDDLSVWADMTHVIEREDWDPAVAPKSLRYHCGAMTGNYLALPHEPSVPALAHAAVRAEAERWLNAYAAFFWPKGVEADGFDWTTLVAPPALAGSDRLNAQYLRANIDPSERCPVSATGVIGHRFHQGDTGFFNLYVCGDWTYTSINSCCVEAAVMSGMQASRALCGFPTLVSGERFMQS